MSALKSSARISYVVMAVALFLIAWLQLGVLVLTSLFGYFALGKLRMSRSKHFAVALYLVAVVSMGYLLVRFAHQSSVAVPKIANQTIPAVVGYAEQHNIELPFTDYESAKTSNTERYARFFQAMLRRGVYLAPSQFEAAFVSLAHREADIEQALVAANEVAAEIA